MSHIPILTNKVTQLLVDDLDGIYVDCTAGLGGHSSAILSKLSSKGFLIGLDVDPDALDMAKKKLSTFNGKRYSLHNASYINFPEIFSILGVSKVNGFLFDLGISSYQVDSKHRGFSYRYNSNLDMRFNNKTSLTAKEYIKNIDKANLLEVLQIYGQVKYAKRITESILCQRRKGLMNTTFDLKNAVTKINNNNQLLSQVFQAIRIGVNDEINILKKTLLKISDYLELGGKIAIISFHSIEDRIVKHFFKNACLVSSTDYYKKEACVDSKYKVLTKKPIIADHIEIAKNSRARSAKLRVAQKIK